jgi:hypothetical protein
MRVNIYLPDDLAAEYERHKDRIKLSTICQEALRRELKVIGTTHHNATVQRLRESRRRDVEAETQDGRREARAWVERSAEWSELRTIAEMEQLDGWRINVLDWGISRSINDGRDEVEIRELSEDDPWAHGFVAEVVTQLQALEEDVVNGEDPGHE